MRDLHSYFDDSRKLQRLVSLTLFVIIFGTLGVYFLIGSHAASPYASINADAPGNTIISPAVKQTCSGASDGSCVVFGAQSSGGGGGGTQSTNCFASPGACGYPDPNFNNNTGTTSVGSTTPCASLPASGGVTASTNGQTVQNLNITGSLSITAPNITVNNVCVTTSGGNGALAVVIGSGATNLLLEHSTFRGSAATGNGVIDTGVWNAPNTTNVNAEAIYIYNAAEDWHGWGNVKDSYMQAGATFGSGSGVSHNEDVYMSDTTWSGTHDTLFNSTGQTAVLFGDNDGGTKDKPADNHWVLKNSLIGGGGYLMYLDAANNDSMPVGSSTMDIENNRVARCLGTSVFDGSGHTCKGLGNGADDGHGYFPEGGYYGGPVDDYCSGSGQTWSNNVWDDNNAAVSC